MWHRLVLACVKCLCDVVSHYSPSNAAGDIVSEMAWQWRRLCHRLELIVDLSIGHRHDLAALCVLCSHLVYPALVTSRVQ